MRNSNIDLLKALSVFSVVILYVNGYAYAAYDGTINDVIFGAYWGIESLCFSAVSIFILISSYFFLDKKQLTIKSIGNVYIITVDIITPCFKKTD